MCTVFILLAVFMTAALIAYRYETELVVSLPVSAGGLILVLYLLAFFRGMEAIVVIAGIVVIAEVACCVKKKELKKVLLGICTIQNLIAAVFLVLIVIAGKDFIAYWWDDINYWTTDAKAMYYLNGFPGKYGNVAPEFGDYPPAISLFKWVFLKMSITYNEGLAYSGYQALVFILCLPLLKAVKCKNKMINVLAQTVGCIVLILLPTVCNIVCFEGTCAEVPMGLMYGNLICAIVNLPKEEKRFNLNAWMIAIYSGLIVLTKNVGMEWAGYGLILFFIITFGQIPKEKRKYALAPWALPVMACGTWFSLCMLNRRVAKLTSASVHMATGGNFNPSDYVDEKIGYFVKGFLAEPMHTNSTGILDLSAVSFFAILTVVFAYITYYGILERKKGKVLVIYTIITGLLAYGIVFLGHITIFATETQYQSSEVMAISMSRYAAPFTVGMLFVAISLLTQKDNWKITLACGLFVLLTCDYAAPVTGLITYRDKTDEVIKGREDMTADATKFIAAVDDDTELWGHRVLYLRDGGTVHWVHDTYINNAAAPVAVVYGSVDAESDEEYLRRIIDESHVVYVYVDDVDGLDSEAFEAVLGVDYAPEKICRVR